MPIHTSWKSMAEGMKKTYNSGAMACRPFTDGTKVCMRAKAWSVFFATIRKMGADETKSRPTKIKTGEAKVIHWFLESKGVESPSWVPLAKKILSGKQYNQKTKSFWKGKLDNFCKKNPDNKACKGD